MSRPQPSIPSPPRLRRSPRRRGSPPDVAAANQAMTDVDPVVTQGGEVPNTFQEPRRLLTDSTPPRGPCPRSIRDQIMDGDDHEDPFCVDTQKAQVYTYFDRMSKKLLREIGRVWARKSNGNRPDYVLRNYRFVMFKRGQGRDVESVIGNNPKCPPFDHFVRSMELMCADFQRPPSDAQIDVILTRLGDPPEGTASARHAVPPTGAENDANANTPGVGGIPPDFSISEFARLVVILREDPTSRQALFNLGQELTRTELDSGRSRDTFWGTVATRFNDPSVAPTFSFIGTVEEAMPELPPLCDRPASLLKQYFQEARSKFTLYTEKWKVSGQNDPQKFVDFLPKRGDVLYAISKRVMIMFTAAKMGTANADTFFIDISSKAITTGGYDEGLPSDRSHIVSNDDESGSTGSRKRRRNSSDASQSLDARWRDMQNLLGQMVTAQAPTQSASASEPMSEISRALKSSKESDEMMGVVESAHMKLLRARERPEDERYLKLAENHYEKIMARYNALLEKEAVQEESRLLANINRT